MMMMMVTDSVQDMHIFAGNNINPQGVQRMRPRFKGG